MTQSQNPDIFVEIQEQPLDMNAASGFVQDDRAGAVNIFCGNTRNHHDGQKVLKLYYDCYRDMALSELIKIAESTFNKYGLIKLFVVHRTGLVPVGESSVMVAACGAHRKETFAATMEIMNLLKQDVPIWKKEFYEETAGWK